MPPAPLLLAIQAPGNSTFIKLNRIQHERTRTDGRATFKDHGISPHPKHTRLKKHFLSYRNPVDLPAARMSTIGAMSHMPICSPQSSLAPPHRDLGGKITCLDVPLAYVCRRALSREQWRLALSKLDKLFEVRKHMGPACAVSVLTDQLMMLYSSGRSTLNGTYGGDRWARVVGGQIGWLS